MNSAFKNFLLVAGAAERTDMERTIVSHRKLLQGQKAGMVEHMCTGQKDCRSGMLTASLYRCLLAVTMEGQWSQTDGTFRDLTVSSLLLDFLPFLLSDLTATSFI